MLTTSMPPMSYAAGTDWGDVPTWIGSCATLLGLGAASIAAFFVWRQVKEIEKQTKAVTGQVDEMKKQTEAVSGQVTEMGKQTTAVLSQVEEMKAQNLIVQEQAKALSSQAKAAHGQLDEMRQSAADNRLLMDRKLEEFAEVDRLRARVQAEKIEVSLEWAYADLPNIDRDMFPVFTIKNESNRPIRHVECRANPLHGDQPTHPVNDYVGHIERVEIDTDVPDELFFKWYSYAGSPIPVLKSGWNRSFLLRVAAQHFTFWFQFQDDSDLWWHLDGDLRLKRIRPEERWGVDGS
jgi:hypothetical protein